MHGAPWSLRTGTGPEHNRIKRLAQSERAWHKAAWSYTMMLLVHAGGHSEGNLDVRVRARQLVTNRMRPRVLKLCTQVNLCHDDAHEV